MNNSDKYSFSCQSHDTNSSSCSLSFSLNNELYEFTSYNFCDYSSHNTKVVEKTVFTEISDLSKNNISISTTRSDNFILSPTPSDLSDESTFSRSTSLEASKLPSSNSFMSFKSTNEPTEEMSSSLPHSNIKNVDKRKPMNVLPQKTTVSKKAAVVKHDLLTKHEKKEEKVMKSDSKPSQPTTTIDEEEKEMEGIENEMEKVEESQKVQESLYEEASNQSSSNGMSKSKKYTLDDYPPDHFPIDDYIKRRQLMVDKERSLLKKLRRENRAMILKYHYFFRKIRRGAPVTDFSKYSRNLENIEPGDINNYFNVSFSKSNEFVIKKFKGNEEVQTIYTKYNRIFIHSFYYLL